MRVIGVFFIGLSVAGYGFFVTYKLINKSRQLQKIICFIEDFEHYIRYKKEPLPQLINKLKNNSDYAFLLSDLSGISSKDFNDICYNNKQLYIEKEQKNSLYSFLAQLGKSDLNEQIAHCENYKNIFNSYLNKNNEDDKSKIKLYPSLFIMLGMFIVLLLI